MKVREITETVTAASSIATVSGNLGPMQSRNMYNADGTMKNGLEFANLLGGGPKPKKKKKTRKNTSILYTEKTMRHNEIKKKVNEGGLADMAQRVEQDHEVQMARSDLYKLAKYSIKLHNMLAMVPETKGIEGWQQAKITKAADYISSVYHNLDYEMKFDQQQVAEKKKSSYKDGLSAMLESKKKTESTDELCKECGKPSWKTLDEEKQKGVDGKVCWKGYRRMGTKKKNGKTVDNCVKVG